MQLLIVITSDLGFVKINPVIRLAFKCLL